MYSMTNQGAGVSGALSKHDSSLVTFSSADAVNMDSKLEAGAFTCNLNNSNRGGTHAVKVVPNLIMIPNVIQNITERFRAEDFICNIC